MIDARTVWLALVVFVAIASAARGQRASIRLLPERTEVAFGEPFSLQVERTWPPELEPSPWDDDAIRPLAVLGSDVATTTSAQGIVEHRSLEVACWAVGAVTIPPIRIVAGLADGSVVERAESEPLRLEVSSSLGDPPGEVEPPEAGRRASPLPAILVVGVGILVNVGAAIWVFRRRADAVAPVSADAAAFAILDDSAAPIGDRVARALRGYTANVSAIPACALSTPELEQHASIATLPDHVELLAILARCDRARFGADEVDSDLVGRARAWIENVEAAGVAE